ncbi:MAG: hypothetical protein J2P36_38215 [Ktedonobacteraceae bacterium]|nr:hypothetical protein [Ktedonobacteraceae bacterium]
MHTRKGETTPPRLIGKSNCPVGLLTGPSNQSVSRRFFGWYNGSGLLMGCLARLQDGSALWVEVFDHTAHELVVAAQLLGDDQSADVSGRCQQDKASDERRPALTYCCS